MKKKIILGLSAYSVLFLFMGLYIVYTIQIGTAKLNNPKNGSYPVAGAGNAV
ncbi:MAG: hypothetical protein NUW14_03295 [Deltaproteobacteria bacterium]|nr:hypothetical protein [Deltaproteobacteria bacterium]